MGIGNTDYETDGTNNELTLTCKVNHPLTLVPITPNAAYREQTEVVSSFWLKNGYTDNYTPADEVDVRFKVYRNSTLLHTETIENVVVPGSDKNLLYFKWKVPTGINGGQVKITGEIIDDGKSYNLKNMYNSRLCGTWKAINTGAAVTAIKSRSCIENEDISYKCICDCESSGTVPMKP